ncbi:ATPaseAAA family protein, partial [Aphelenchoides avenae]
RLIRDRRFSIFHLPVDPEEVEDYYEVIKSPMSLSEMMNKVDQKKYTRAEQFLDDIRLIRYNAIEYNPDKEMEEKVIRHNANGLMDMAEALFDMELDEKFAERLEETARMISEAENGGAAPEKNAENGSGHVSGPVTPAVNGSALRKRRIYFGSNKRRPSSHLSSAAKRLKFQADEAPAAQNDASGNEAEGDATRSDDECKNGTEEQRGSSSSPRRLSNGTSPAEHHLSDGHSTDAPGPSFSSPVCLRNGHSSPVSLKLDKRRIDAVLHAALSKTAGWSVPDLECLGAELSQHIDRFRDAWDRQRLPQELLGIIDKFRL